MKYQNPSLLGYIHAFLVQLSTYIIFPHLLAVPLLWFLSGKMKADERNLINLIYAEMQKYACFYAKLIAGK